MNAFNYAVIHVKPAIYLRRLPISKIGIWIIYLPIIISHNRCVKSSHYNISIMRFPNELLFLNAIFFFAFLVFNNFIEVP